MNRVNIALIGTIFAIGTASGASAQTPRLTQAQARTLYAAGGFPISADGKNPTNRCGKAANPTITFVDMNGDGRKEALFIDQGSCYATDGRWYAVATLGPDGSWRRILDGEGRVQTVGTMANGWFALKTFSGGKSQDISYDGRVYRAAGDPAKPGTPTASGKPAASAPGGKPGAHAPGPAQANAAIFKAAGFKQTRRGWESGCDDPTAGAVYGPGTIETMKDLNGDGRPDAVIIEGGTYCYGNTGQAFWLMSQQADGSWKLMLSNTGIADFLKTKGAGGWPDIQIGGPGFCFPVVRWNGKNYVENRMEYEGKACKQR